ncbi:MAG: hypothetical protein PBV01_10420 [Brucella anthropi]
MSTDGVGQPVRWAIVTTSEFGSPVSRRFKSGPLIPSFWQGVGHAARWAASIIDVPVFAPRAFFASSVSGDPRVASVEVVVGQPANEIGYWLTDQAVKLGSPLSASKKSITSVVIDFCVPRLPFLRF